MKRFLELNDTEGHIILINVDSIQHITVNDYEETIVEMCSGDFFTVSQTYDEIREIIKNVNM